MRSGYFIPLVGCLCDCFGWVCPQTEGMLLSRQSYMHFSLLMGSSNCPFLVPLGLWVVTALFLVLSDCTILCGSSVLRQHFVNSPFVNELFLNHPRLRVYFFSYCDPDEYTKLWYRVLTQQVINLILDL